MSASLDLNNLDKKIIVNDLNNYPELGKIALKKLKELGIPNKKHEHWKYTDISEPMQLLEKSLNTNYQKLSEVKTYKDNNPGGIDAHWLNINGIHFDKGEIIEIEGNPIRINCLNEEQAIKELKITDPLCCLNAILAEKIIKITIPEDSVFKSPLGISYIEHSHSQKYSSNLRFIIDIKKNSKVSFIGFYGSCLNESHFSNIVTQINLAENSDTEYLKIQNLDETHNLIDRSIIDLGPSSKINYTTVDIGSKLSRTDVEVNLSNEKSSAVINGVYLCEKNQHIDNHIWSNHISQSTSSTQCFYGIIGEKGHCVFNGKALIKEKAFDTEANQYNHNILLDDSASVDTKPELEIYNDSVKCSHGCTIGQLDEDAIFYMKSRGIDSKTAKSLLISAFVKNILSKINTEAPREYLDELITSKLERL